MRQTPAPFGTSTPNIFSYEKWLDSFLRVILRAALGFGLLLLAGSLFSHTEPILLALYSTAYVGLLFATFVKLPYRFKASLFLFLLFALGVSGLLENGIRGDSRLFFPIFIIMTAMLFGQKSVGTAIVLTILATLGVGIPILSGYLPLISAGRGITVGAWDAWAMALIENIVLALLVTTGLRMLQDEFNLAEKFSRQALTELNVERSKLETRVDERTKDLERRAKQLQVAADVGSAAARLRDLGELLNQTTTLISERFNFYHVGIFLVDEEGEYAVLRSSNSEGGQRMLVRGHKLKIGQVGIVGYVTGLGEPRIALDVGKDATYFDNPDLPETRSEMALPLMVGNRILGALDVQSREEVAFTEEDISILKVLADQVAIAIDNARLFSDTQAALENTRRAYAEVSREGWQRLLRERQTEVGYVSQPSGDILPITHEVSKEYVKALSSRQVVLSNEDTTLHVPIFIRDEPIGVVRLDKQNDGSRWTKDQIGLAGTLSEQLAIALESARLYQDISQRAERENVISDITTKINSSIQLDVILRNTVQELGHALGDSEIILQLGSHVEKGKKRD
jgi:GAF domain-containing protein